MPPRKRVRPEVFSLRNLHGVSNSALSDILQRLKQSSLLKCEAPTEKDLRLKTAAEFSEVQFTLSLELEAGGRWDWQFCDPGVLLRLLVQKPSLQRAYAEAWSKNPGSIGNPWHLVVGFDEYQPGNALAHANHRKVMVISFTFLELSAADKSFWSNEHFWVTPAVVRHHKAKEVKGGYSAVLSAFLQHLLTGDTGMSTVGVPLTLPQGTVCLFARLSHIIADGEGFELLFQWRGASSLRPCLRHWNIVPVNSGISHRSEDYQELSCCDSAKFLALTRNDYRQLAQVVVDARADQAAGRITNAQLQRTLKGSGFNCTAEGFLMNQTLMAYIDPAECLTVDWMHTFLQDGCLSVEIHCFMRVAGISAGTLESFLRDEAWEWPSQRRQKGKALHEVFSASRNSETKLKATASELLAVYGMVRHFVEARFTTIPAAGTLLDKAMTSFFAVCSVIDTPTRNVYEPSGSNSNRDGRNQTRITLKSRLFAWRNPFVWKFCCICIDVLSKSHLL